VYTPYETLGLEDKTKIEVVIFPNPSFNFFTIKTDNQNVSHFEIYTAEGRKVKNVLWDVTSQKSIDCKELGPGVFLLIAFDDLNSPIHTQQLILL
jgi:hypothetical protein